MKAFFSDLRPAIVATFLLAAVTCGAYPALVTGIAQVVFPAKANGSLILDKDGQVRGSSLIGQSFTAERYFHSRPSAAGTGYDGTSSSGSNLGPTSQKLHDQIQERITTYRTENALSSATLIPADAVTASGSGLDPHISPANAALQVSRVAKARSLSEDRLRTLITQNTDARDFSLLGEPGVNVVKLNIALDAAQ